MHFGDPELGCVGMVSMLPDMAQVAAGMALAFKLRSEPRVAMTFFGEGSTANGQWHEAMNFAGVHQLPVVYLLENNRFAYSTPTELEYAVDPVERAAGYGFPGVSVDGNDVEAVFEAAREAADRARSGGGPTLIECHTMRMHGHGAHDDMSYVPPELFEEWGCARPDRAATATASPPSTASPTDELDEIRSEVEREVAEAAERALASRDARPGDRPAGRLRRPDRAARRRPRAVVALERSAPRPRGGPHELRTDDRLRTNGRGGRDDLPRGDLGRPARGDARRRVGDLPRRGHRRVRRRLQGHRRVPRGVRPQPRDRHAARREHDPRRRDRRRDRGDEAGLRDAVRGLHRLRLRPAGQRRREDALPPGDRRADRGPAALGRRVLGRPVPLPEPGGLVPAVARA